MHELYQITLASSEPYDSARDILDWLVEQVEGDEIEDVTDEMLNKMIRGEQGGTGAIFCEFCCPDNNGLEKAHSFVNPPSFHTSHAQCLMAGRGLTKHPALDVS